MAANAWDKAQERSKQVSDGLFVKLDDGDKIVATFLGDPHIDENVWNEKLGKYEPFDAKIHGGKTPTPKYRMNVFVWTKQAQGSEKKEKIEKVQIIDCNNATFKDVLKVRDKFGLDKWCFEVERQGKKGDTKTTYSVMPEVQMDDAMLAKIKEAKLHDLTKTKDEGDDSTDMNSHGKAGGDKAKGGPAGDALITTEQSQALVARLKVLPREKLTAFLKQFGVAQIKQVKAADFAAACAMVDEFEGKPKAEAAPAAPAEEDPFA
jgi:hypothetical protein